MADRKKTPDLLASVLGDANAPENKPVLDDELPITIQPAPGNGAATTVASATSPVKSASKSSAKSSAKSKGGKKAKTKSGAKAKAVQTVQEPAPVAPAAPMSWEYLTVTFRDYGGWRPRFVNGAQVRGWKEQPLIHDYLAQLGAQGWEMVSMGERHRNQKEAFFKRPLPQES